MVARKGGFTVERFWDWVPRVREKWTEGELVEEYQALLEDAVKLQLRSDVPLGLFLSSGIDSGVLLAIMRKYTNGPVQTFTIGFEGGEKTNEVEDAAKMAKMFGADHYFQMLAPEDYVKYYDRYMWDLEEPVGNETAAAFYFVSGSPAQKVKVALTGRARTNRGRVTTATKASSFPSLYSRCRRRSATSCAAVADGRGRMEKLKRGVASLANRTCSRGLPRSIPSSARDLKAQLYKGRVEGRSSSGIISAREWRSAGCRAT